MIVIKIPRVFFIKDFPNYKISETGNVYSKRRGCWRRMKATKFSKIGYLKVKLTRNTIRRDVLVHVLVLEAFDKPRPVGLVCRHLDGNPENNNIKNLCWGTRKENEADKKRHGRVNHGERNGRATFNESQILEIQEMYATGLYLQRDLAELYGMCQQHVSDIVNHKTWEYLNEQ